MSQIHSTSVVSAGADIGHDVRIGPFCVVEPDVSIGDGCQLEGRVTVKSGTHLGHGNYLAEGTILGGLPQHKCAPGAPGRLIVGDHNTIRENVTIHRGLTPDAETRLGSNNLVMVNAHIAHDCHLGHDIILANNVLLAGHVTVGDRAYLSGAVGVHQFCRIGQFAMVGGQAHITKDVPPFVTIDGVSSRVVGLNLVGLKRAGFTPEEIGQLKAAYRMAFRSGLRWDAMLFEMRQRFATGRAAALHAFMAETKRGCVPERATPRAATVRLHLPDPDSPDSADAETSEGSATRSAA